MPYKDPEKQREYQRVWYSRRRAAYIEGKECARKDPTCSGPLELDHIDPNVKVTHRIWSYSEKRRTKELKKCQVLCHGHHQNKSIRDMETLRKHGTASAYLRYHCRCPDCMALKENHPEELRAYLENCGNIKDAESATREIEDSARETDGQFRPEEIEQAFTQASVPSPALG